MKLRQRSLSMVSTALLLPGIITGCSTVDDRAILAAVGSALGSAMGGAWLGSIQKPTRTYVGISPKIIVDHAVGYFSTKDYLIQEKSYSMGLISGNTRPRIIKKVLWLKWKEKNQFLCRIQVDLIEKDRVYLFFYKQTKRKEPLSEEYRPTNINDALEDELDGFIKSLDAIIVENGGKMG